MRITKSFKHEEVIGFKFGYSPIGKPNLFVHIYFVDGLLIDTGQSRMRKEILSTTQNLSIDQIYVTHFHEDHSGNIRALQEQFNCQVYASEKCCQIMKRPPKISFIQNIYWGNRRAYSNLISKDTVIESNNFKFDIIPIPGHSSDMVALYEPNRKWLFFRRFICKQVYRLFYSR